jgi:glycosyltransferase involved in cell wall biosynthesis
MLIVKDAGSHAGTGAVTGRGADAPTGRTQPTDVALFMPTLIGGGAEKIQLILAEHFLAQGLRVDVVVCKGVGALRDRVPAGARLVDLGARRVLLALGRYERYLSAARPRVVLSSVENASLIACAARARGGHPHRLIVRQDNALVAAASAWHVPRRWPWLLALGLAYRFADQLVAVSEGVEGQLRALLGRRGPPVRFIPNAVLTPDLESLLRAEPALPWADRDVPLLAAAGRLSPVKDYPTLLRAFALLRREKPHRLVIMGEGDLRPELEALCRELGIADDVWFAGFVENPLAVIHRADAFVLSSTSEGMPGVLIEALAAGTRIVSTDSRHGPREVLHGGRYGRLVPVGDPAALAAACADALAAPRPGPSQDLTRYLDRFTVEHSGRAYSALLAASTRQPAQPAAPVELRAP